MLLSIYFRCVLKVCAVLAFELLYNIFLGMFNLCQSRHSKMYEY
jgi:hypothetical protein